MRRSRSRESTVVKQRGKTCLRMRASRPLKYETRLLFIFDRTARVILVMPRPLPGTFFIDTFTRQKGDVILISQRNSFFYFPNKKEDSIDIPPYIGNVSWPNDSCCYLLKRRTRNDDHTGDKTRLIASPSLFNSSDVLRASGRRMRAREFSLVASQSSTRQWEFSRSLWPAAR